MNASLARHGGDRFMAGRMGADIRSHNVDHTPMYTAPELVVDVILEAAQ